MCIPSFITLALIHYERKSEMQMVNIGLTAHRCGCGAGENRTLTHTWTMMLGV